MSYSSDIRKEHSSISHNISKKIENNDKIITNPLMTDTHNIEVTIIPSIAKYQIIYYNR